MGMVPRTFTYPTVSPVTQKPMQTAVAKQSDLVKASLLRCPPPKS